MVKRPVIYPWHENVQWKKQEKITAPAMSMWTGWKERQSREVPTHSSSAGQEKCELCPSCPVSPQDSQSSSGRMSLSIILSRLASALWMNSPCPLSSVGLVHAPWLRQRWATWDSFSQVYTDFPPLLVGSGLEACNFPLGLIISSLFLA